MKRIILTLLLITLPVACMQSQTEQSGLASPVPETQSETVEEIPLQSVPTEAAPTAPATDVPEETRPPQPTEPPKAQPAYIGVTNETLTDTLELPITIKEIDWVKLSAGKQYETKFYNETVNFQDLRVTVTDFVSDEGGTQFTMRLDLPEEWTDLQCLSMNPCFGFRFYLDGKAQHDFRLIAQDPILSEALSGMRCNSVTMTYRSDTVTDAVMHAAHEWKIVPFFYYHTGFPGSKVNGHPGGYISLEQGDVCKVNGSVESFGGKFAVTELNELTLTLPIDRIDGVAPASSPEPRMLQVTAWTEDVERNKKEGKYGSDGQLKDGLSVVYGTYQNHTVDFSQFEIHIERFYYWDHGFVVVIRYDFPTDWPEEVRNNLRIRFDTYADDNLFGKPGKNGRIYPYFVPGISADYAHLNDAMPLSLARLLVCDSKAFSLENPFPAKELTFKFYLEYSPTVSDINGKKYDISDGNPFYVEKFIIYDLEKVPLFEITIPTDQLVFQKGDAQ